MHISFKYIVKMMKALNVSLISVVTKHSKREERQSQGFLLWCPSVGQNHQGEMCRIQHWIL